MTQFRFSRPLAVLGVMLGLAVIGAEPDDMQLRLDEAQSKLDEAAREFAELHKELARSRLENLDHDFTTEVTAEHHGQPFLGVLIGGQTPDGVLVAGVTPDGSADQAGIAARDVITAINGTALGGDRFPMRAFHEALGRVEIGESVQLDVLRDSGALDEHVPQSGTLRALDEHVRQSQTRKRSSDDYGIPQSGTLMALTFHVTAEAHEPGRYFGTPGSFATPVAPLIVNGNAMMPGPGVHRAESLALHANVIRRVGTPRLADIDADLGAYFGVGNGVLVLDAPESSDLKGGDVIIAINDVEVDSSIAAYQRLATLKETGEATIWRQHGQQVVPVQPIGNFGATATFIDMDIGGAVELRSGADHAEGEHHGEGESR